MRKIFVLSALALLVSCGALAPVGAQDNPPGAAAMSVGAPQPGMTTLTIFLRHDQTQTLDGINERLARQHFYESFPPRGVEVVSWYVMMGIGQVVTLRFPAERLRDINRAVEQTAWGPYRTEFYPTYDYRPTAQKEREGMPSAFK